MMRTNPISIFLGSLMFFVAIGAVLALFLGSFASFGSGQAPMGIILLIVALLIMSGIVTVMCMD